MSDNRSMSMPTDQRDRPTTPHGQADADRLLNEVFRDVDQMLDRAQELPQEPANHKPIALKPLQVPPIVVQPLVAPAMQPSAVEPASVEVAINSQGRRAEDKSLLWFDRLLLGGAFLSLAVILGLWLFNRGYFSQWFGGESTPTETTSSPSVPVTENPGRAVDEDFIAYMGQALDRIENRQALPDTLDPPAPVSPSDTGTLNIPVDTTSPDAVAQSLSRIANALERVSTTPVPLPDLPSEEASAAASNGNGSETVVQVPEIPPVLRDLPPAPSRAATATPSPAETEQTPSQEPSTPQRTAAAPAGIYALVGTLERGKVNGLPPYLR